MDIYRLIEKRLIVIFSLLIVLYLTYFFSAALLPFIIAFVLSYLFNPLVGWLTRYCKSRALSVVVLYVLIGLVLVILLSLIIPQLWHQIGYIEQQLPQVFTWLNQTMVPWLQTRLHIPAHYFQIEPVTAQVLAYIKSTQGLNSTQGVLLSLLNSSMSALGFIAILALVPVVMFYFLLDWQRMTQRLFLFLPHRYQADAKQIAQTAHDIIRAFVKGQLLVVVVLAAGYSIALSLIGLKMGLLIGLIAGVFSLVPYLGFLIGIVAALTAVLFQYGLDWLHICLVLLVFAMANLIESYVLQPYLVGNKLGLSPVMTIFAIIAGAVLAGILGMLLALPTMALLFRLGQYVFARYTHSDFYGAPPPSRDSDATINSEY